MQLCFLFYCMHKQAEVRRTSCDIEVATNAVMNDVCCMCEVSALYRKFFFYADFTHLHLLLLLVLLRERGGTKLPCDFVEGPSIFTTAPHFRLQPSTPTPHQRYQIANKRVWVSISKIRDSGSILLKACSPSSWFSDQFPTASTMKCSCAKPSTWQNLPSPLTRRPWVASSCTMAKSLAGASTEQTLL